VGIKVVRNLLEEVGEGDWHDRSSVHVISRLPHP
jgi:hypothetical protein